MAYPCPDPQFTWMGWAWSPCTQCGRLAWDHEQADPLQDIRNVIHQWRQGLRPGSDPPAMKPAESDTP